VVIIVESPPFFIFDLIGQYSHIRQLGTEMIGHGRRTANKTDKIINFIAFADDHS
jgi:hypothetical protein